MIKTIEYCYKNKIPVSFFCNRNYTTKHHTGYIESYNENEIIIAHITPTGLYDGYIYEMIDNIFRIDYDSVYEKKIEKLYKLKKQKHDPIEENAENNGAIFFDILDRAMKKDLIVSLKFEDYILSGFVTSYSDDTVTISLVDDNGVKDGTSCVNIDDVCALRLDTDYEQDLKLLIQGAYEHA